MSTKVPCIHFLMRVAKHGRNELDKRVLCYNPKCGFAHCQREINAVKCHKDFLNLLCDLTDELEQLKEGCKETERLRIKLFKYDYALKMEKFELEKLKDIGAERNELLAKVGSLENEKRELLEEVCRTQLEYNQLYHSVQEREELVQENNELRQKLYALQAIGPLQGLMPPPQGMESLQRMGPLYGLAPPQVIGIKRSSPYDQSAEKRARY